MPKRFPAKKKAKKSKKGRSKKRTAKAKTRIRVDPLKEYAEVVANQGIATVSQLSQDECVSNIPGRVSTGCLSLDQVLSNKGEPEDWHGIPLSRIIEIFGPPHIGKSTLLDQCFSSVQKKDGIAFLLDTETSRDRHYVERLGVDLTKLQYIEFKPENTFIENVLRVVSDTIIFCKEKIPEVPVVIGWDALAGTATEDEMSKGIKSEKATKPGAAAKSMALAARLVSPLLKGTKIVFIILNHEYDVINTGPFAGKKRETYGGHGTRHMASVRVQLYNGKNYIKRSDGWILGREVVGKVIKNRLGEHSREAIMPMVIGQGTMNLYTIYYALKKANLIAVSGNWAAINLDGEVINFQGWYGLQVQCEERPELYEKLEAIFWRSSR